MGKYRLLGDYRAGGDMRVGSLVKHIEHECIGVVVDINVVLKDVCGVCWIGDLYWDFTTICELEVLCV